MRLFTEVFFSNSFKNLQTLSIHKMAEGHRRVEKEFCSPTVWLDDTWDHINGLIVKQL